MGFWFGAVREIPHSDRSRKGGALAVQDLEQRRVLRVARVVAAGDYRRELVAALVVGEHVPGVLVAEHVVIPDTVGRPDVDDRVWDWRAVRAEHATGQD